MGRHAYAFRFVKKQKCGHVHVIQDRPPHIQRSVGLSSRSVRMPGGCIAWYEVASTSWERARDVQRLLEIIEEVPAGSMDYHPHSCDLRLPYLPKEPPARSNICSITITLNAWPRLV